MALTLMYITNSLPVALIAQKYGVDRVWIDLETLGKEERQKGRDSVKSHHTIEDIKVIKPFLNTSELLVRINPWYEGSSHEIESVIDGGADMIMLPYWKTLQEVRDFIKAVNHRCKTTLLLETKEAVEIVDDVLENGEFDEIHIGLNDLHISYGLDFMFELLTNGVVETLCHKFSSYNVPYGFGGIAKIGDGAIPAEKIIMDHYRLGSTRAILSRTFCDNAKIDSIEEIDRVFKINMKKIRDYEKSVLHMDDVLFLKNRNDLKTDVASIREVIRSHKAGGNDAQGINK